MQSRVAYQRERRAALASETSLWAAHAPGQKARLFSMGAVAVTVAAATFLPTATAPEAVEALEFEPFAVTVAPQAATETAIGFGAEIEIEIEEQSTIEAVLEAHAELLDIDRPIVASRSADRIALAEVFYEEVESEQFDLFLTVADVLSTAELYLTNEARTTPEVAEEIREAATYLRQIIQAVTYVYDEDERWEIYETIDWLTERLENAFLEAQPPVAVAEPRDLTRAETFAVLVEQAVADAPRLAAAYANLHANHSNGRIPESLLRPLSWSPNHRLRPDAAEQLERLNEAFRLEFGTDLIVSSSYRTFAGQQRLWPTGRGARPGTSMHGWGLAVDLSGGINRFGTPQTRWMRANAPYFGWNWPSRTPWHWEFTGH